MKTWTNFLFQSAWCWIFNETDRMLLHEGRQTCIQTARKVHLTSLDITRYFYYLLTLPHYYITFHQGRNERMQMMEANTQITEIRCSRSHLCIGSKKIQSCDVEAKLIGLRKLPKTSSHWHEFVPGNICCQLENFFTVDRKWGYMNGSFF